MSRLIVVTTPHVLALMERLKADGHELPEGTELVPVDPQDPEWCTKMDLALADGAMGSCQGITIPNLDAPYQDEHLGETHDRKLSAQLSPRQDALPPNLRKRRM